MKELASRINIALSKHGPTDLAKLGWYKFCQYATPSGRSSSKIAQEAGRSFDAELDIDTTTHLQPAKEDVVGEHWKEGNSYRGAEADAISELIEEVLPDCKGYDFIDLGAGKGRPLLVAASYPFRKAVGIEYSGELFETLQTNVDKFPGSRKVCQEIDVQHLDASEFAYPEVPFFLFMYNPFRDLVMQKFIDNVEASLAENPRDAVVVYMNPVCADLWKQSTVFEEVSCDDYVQILRHQSASQS